MTPENFAYWLKGLLEVGNPTSLDEKQLKIIKDHLDLVFTKVTPDRNDENTNEHKMNTWTGPYIAPAPLPPYNSTCTCSFNNVGDCPLHNPPQILC